MLGSWSTPTNYDVLTLDLLLLGSKNTEKNTREYRVDYGFTEFHEIMEHAQTVETRPFSLSRVLRGWKRAWGRGYHRNLKQNTRLHVEVSKLENCVIP